MGAQRLHWKEVEFSSLHSNNIEVVPNMRNCQKAAMNPPSAFRGDGMSVFAGEGLAFPNSIVP
jgi:hypothetical protein